MNEDRHALPAVDKLDISISLRRVPGNPAAGILLYPEIEAREWPASRFAIELAPTRTRCLSQSVLSPFSKAKFDEGNDFEACSCSHRPIKFSLAVPFLLRNATSTSFDFHPSSTSFGLPLGSSSLLALHL
jgi:hypothetical protein